MLRIDQRTLFCSREVIYRISSHYNELISQATTLGLLGGLHFQLGHFLSAILAGEFITRAGFKAAWWIYATFILAIGALYVTADTLLPKIGEFHVKAKSKDVSVC